MKEEAQQPWEAAVRRVVETHEFEYDPAAWAGMEELLDQAALPYAKPTSSWWAQVWKWLLPSVVAVGLISWVAWPTAVEPPSLEGGLPIVVSRPPAKTAPAETATSDGIEPLKPPYANIKPLPLLPVRNQLLDVPLPETPEMVNVLPPVLEPLPTLPLPKELASNTGNSNSLTTDFKRKRNRKSLFPDVIKNY